MTKPTYRDFLISSLNGIDLEDQKNKKEIIEICHVTKFLFHFNLLGFVQKREIPDFMVEVDNEVVGIEHTICVNELKEKEGYVKNICEKIEEKYDKEVKLLLNVYFKPSFDPYSVEKTKLRSSIENVILNYSTNQIVVANDYIDKIVAFNHNQLNISPNFGAFKQRWITEDDIRIVIKKKEKRLSDYTSKLIDKKIWLLIVISNTSESSYEVDNLAFPDLNSEFERIYLFEDFKNLVHRIK